MSTVNLTDLLIMPGRQTDLSAINRLNSIDIPGKRESEYQNTRPKLSDLGRANSEDDPETIESLMAGVRKKEGLDDIKEDDTDDYLASY